MSYERTMHETNSIHLLPDRELNLLGDAGASPALSPVGHPKGMGGIAGD